MLQSLLVKELRQNVGLTIDAMGLHIGHRSLAYEVAQDLSVFVQINLQHQKVIEIQQQCHTALDQGHQQRHWCVTFVLTTEPCHPASAMTEL